MFLLVVLFLLVSGISAFLRSRKSAAEIKGAEGERKVAAEIKRLGLTALHDVYLPSKHGTTQIDHIAQAGNTIIVIETKNYRGTILGTASDYQWRQSFRKGKSTPFLSPILQNKGHVDAVKANVAPGADVRSLVVMAGKAKFPKGKPEGVVTLDEAADWIRKAWADAGKVGFVMKSWERLLEVVANTDRREALDRRVLGRQPNAKKGNRKERIEPTF
jgi:hypothetical protein